MQGWQPQGDDMNQHLWGGCSAVCHGLIVGGADAKMTKWWMCASATG
jgi:hypothetical protein